MENDRSTTKLSSVHDFLMAAPEHQVKRLQITANVPVEYLVYDYDIEGSDQVATRPALDGGVVEDYDVGSYPADVNAEIIETIYKAVAAETGSES